MTAPSLRDLERIYESRIAARLKGFLDSRGEYPSEADWQSAGFQGLLGMWPDEDDFIQNLAWIKTKDPGVLTLLKYNSSQRALVEHVRQQEKYNRPVRVFVLKSRQVGYSTLAQIKLAYRVLTRPHFRATVLAHDKGPALELFEITVRFLENLLFKPKIRTNRRDEIRTERDSKYTCLTAGNEDVGRALNCHWVHFSEFAYYQNAEMVFYGLMQTVGKRPGTGVIIETTANGTGNLAHDIWRKAKQGKNDFHAIFKAWHEHEEYTVDLRQEEADELRETLTDEERWLSERFGLGLNKLAWRRATIRNECNGSEDMFHQEYPSFDDEAFLTSGRPVFSQERLQQLLGEAEEPEMRGNLVMT